MAHAPAALAGAGPKAVVLPPNSEAEGQSYAQWAADWLTWLVQIPLSTSPAADTTGADVAVDQSGSVWFLAGNFGGSTTRTATVPPGKALFFPIINEFWVGSPTDPAWDEPYTDPATGIMYASFQDWVIANVLDPPIDDANVSLTVDGKSVPLGESFRILSTVENAVELPADNLFGGAAAGVPAGQYGPTQSEGYYVLLAPLSAGKHTIHFTGSTDGFSLDVTLNLTVKAH